MFLRVTLWNFRSFDHIVFDLTDKAKRPKNLAIIYGENGSGKSNLVSAFVLVSELMQTMNIRDRVEELLGKTSVFNDEEMQTHFREQLISNMRDMKAIINDYRMVDCVDPICAEFEFVIGSNIGTYYVELGAEEIIREKLVYKLNQRRGVYFDCAPNSISINSSIVKDKDLLSDINAKAKRFWGKHSLLAIISYEISDKSKAFGFENLSENLFDVLLELDYVSSCIGIGKKEWESIFSPFPILNHPINGKIPVEKENQLKIMETVFSSFFSSIHSNIKKLKYERHYHEKYIKYNLSVVRLIAGSYRTIDFDKESKGNHQLIKLLCYLFTSCFSKTVVLDEADSAIHDYLFRKIIQEIRPYITGQIILTTHNTMLMEADLDRNFIYILSEDGAGRKTIQSINDYDKRTYLANNIRNRYLNNEYSGLPVVKEIDFKGLLKTLQEMQES